MKVSEEARCLKVYVVRLVIMMKVSEEIKCLNTLENKETLEGVAILYARQRKGQVLKEM
jgi:hypothetical protein